MPVRTISLKHVRNMRDLGGYPARDGAVTYTIQSFFRSDALTRLSIEKFQKCIWSLWTTGKRC